jgi:hypothetical protein
MYSIVRIGGYREYKMEKKTSPGSKAASGPRNRLADGGLLCVQLEMRAAAGGIAMIRLDGVRSHASGEIADLHGEVGGRRWVLYRRLLLKRSENS